MLYEFTKKDSIEQEEYIIFRGVYSECNIRK